jgi:hypothetical protein
MEALAAMQQADSKIWCRASGRQASGLSNHRLSVDALGAFDCISGGAIIHAALYVLARVRGVDGYHYLTGTKFRQRVDAVVEKFNDMRDDLDKERKFMGRQ